MAGQRRPTVLGTAPAPQSTGPDSRGDNVAAAAGVVEHDERTDVDDSLAEEDAWENGRTVAEPDAEPDEIPTANRARSDFAAVLRDTPEVGGDEAGEPPRSPLEGGGGAASPLPAAAGNPREPRAAGAKAARGAPAFGRAGGKRPGDDSARVLLSHADGDSDESTVADGGFGDDRSTDDELTVDDPRAVAGLASDLAAGGAPEPITRERNFRPPIRASVVGDPARGRLVIVAGNDRGRAHVLTGARVAVGRGIDNDIVLTDIAASRHHLELTFESGRYRVRDVGSGNGTLVNDRLAEAPLTLADGDRMEIGNTIIRIDHPSSRAQAIRPAVGWASKLRTDIDHMEEESTAGGPHEPPTTPESAARKAQAASRANRTGLPRRRPPTRPPPPRRPSTSNPVPPQRLVLPAVPPGASVPAERPAAPIPLRAPPAAASAADGDSLPDIPRLAPPPGDPPLPHPQAGAAPSPVQLPGLPAPRPRPGDPNPQGRPLSTGDLFEPEPVPATGATYHAPVLLTPDTSLTDGRQRNAVVALTILLLAAGTAIGVVALKRSAHRERIAAAEATAPIGPAGHDGPSRPAVPGAAAKTPAKPAGPQTARAKPAAATVAAGSHAGHHAAVQAAKIRAARAVATATLPLSTWGTDEQAVQSAARTRAIQAGRAKQSQTESQQTATAAAPPKAAAKTSDTKANAAAAAKRAAAKRAAAKRAAAKRAADKRAAAKRAAERRATAKRRHASSAARTGRALSRATRDYQNHDFSRAAATLRAAARSAGGREARRLRALASSYERVDHLIARGNAQRATDPAAAMSAYRRALSLDRRAGHGALSSFIHIELRTVAPKAAALYMAQRRYADARRAADAAAAYGAGSNGLVRRVRAALEQRAQQLYSQAVKVRGRDPKQAAALLRRVRAIVPASSPWSRRAAALLR